MTLAGPRQAIAVSSALRTRRWRRFAPVPLIRARLTIALAAVGVVIAVGAGTWLGVVVSALGVPTTTAATALIAVGLLAGWNAGSIWPDLRLSLGERQSWSFYIGVGVSPLAFMVGRHVLDRARRLARVWAFTIAVLVVVGRSHDSLPVETWTAALTSAPAAAAAGWLFAIVRFRGRSADPATIAATVTVLAAFVASVVGWAVSTIGVIVSLAAELESPWSAGLIIASDGVWQASIAGSGALTILAMSVVAHHEWRTEWSEVVGRGESTIERRSDRARGTARGRTIALAQLEVRRAVRSFEWRVRPALFTMLALTLSIIVLGAAANAAIPDQVRGFTAGPVGATVGAGICAGYVLVLFSSLAPMVSLDSDRRGIVVLRMLPSGVRMIAAMRAGTGGAAAGLAGTVFIGLLALLAPIEMQTVGTAATACIAVAVAAPVLTTCTALRFPQTEWKEVAEIGQRGWARALSTYIVGALIAVTVTIASGQSWSALSAATAVAALVTLAPLLAAAVAALLPPSRGAA